jgi:hypothetical protein
MKGKANPFVNAYMQIAFILSVLLCAFPMSNAAFSEIMKTNDSMEESSTETSSFNDTESDALIIGLLSNNLENRLHAAGSSLIVTSQLPQVRNTSSAHLINETLHGIPEDADIEKRQIAQNILTSHKDFQIIVFIMPNGDIYLDEPYERQEVSNFTNLAFRDYFQGAVRTNDTYLGNVNTSASTGQRQALIAVPVYSLEDNSTLAGVWAGGLDFDVLNEELQSLNLTDKRVVYVDNNGSEIADSDADTDPDESFANLTGFRNAIAGESGSTTETIGDREMTVTYAPVKAFHNTWVVLLMRENQ